MGTNHSKESEDVQGRDFKRSNSFPQLHSQSKQKSWKKQLVGLRPMLVDNIDQLESLLDLVEAKNVLPSEAVRKIRETPHNDEKIRLLVHKLLKRTRDDWLKFTECMSETGNGHLITDLADEPSEEAHVAALSEHPMNLQRRAEMPTKHGHVSTWCALSMARSARSKSIDEGHHMIHSAPDSMNTQHTSFRDTTDARPSQSNTPAQARRSSEAWNIPHSSSPRRISGTSNISGMSSRSNSFMGGSPAYSPAYSACSSPSTSAVFGLDSGHESEGWDFDEKGVIGVMTKDLKGRYKKDYKNILLLPWRQDKEFPISQINRNFEMKKENGVYCDVTLDDILMKADEDKNDRFLLEAPAGYGKTSFMKKLAYMWATDDDNLCHFEFVFLISTDEFLEFQSQTEDGSLSDYITSDHFFTKQSLKRCHPKSLTTHLEHNKDRVLFIIDNNYKTELPEDINKVFLRKDMAESTVIFTCRTSQVPPKYLDNAHRYTSLRIIKHHPDTIRKHINEYFQWKRNENEGKALLRNLGIDDNGDILGDTTRLAWLTVPLILVIVAVLWVDMDTDQDTAHEKENFTPDKPYIYQKVLKNIVKKYECHVEGLQSRVCRSGYKEYAEEMHILGKLAWQLVVDKRTGIPKERLLDSTYDKDTAHVLRNVGLLEPFTRLRDGIHYEEYRFVDDIWKFFLAARYLKKEEDDGMIDEKEVNGAIGKVRNLGAGYHNIGELFAKFIAFEPAP